jgi:hypothetical protein
MYANCFFGWLSADALACCTGGLQDKCTMSTECLVGVQGWS